MNNNNTIIQFHNDKTELNLEFKKLDKTRIVIFSYVILQEQHCQFSMYTIIIIIYNVNEYAFNVMDLKYVPKLLC